MSVVLRRCRSSLFSSNNALPVAASKATVFSRSISDDKNTNEPQFSHSTIMVENGLNVHELPLVIRKLRTIAEVETQYKTEPANNSPETPDYRLIKEEFMQCFHLRDVFSLLSKCTKLTPNIALGAIERIFYLEKNPQPSTPMSIPVDSLHINLAKGAILDKLLRVVMKTEDTQTILNILNTVSTFMDPYKPKFCDELLLRVIDNKLTVEQLCEFMDFLIKSKSYPKYSETTDKLWVGFLEREPDIDQKNIVKVYQVLNGFKSSKRTILTLLETKLSDLWPKISVPDMQDILNVFDREKYISLQSLGVVGMWLFANIHAVRQEAMLDVISKLTRLMYNDDQIEKAVEKYMKLKGSKIDTPVLVVGILNYCMKFQIRNEEILNACCNYFIENAMNVPNNFFKSIIYPYGYLSLDPINSSKFWSLVESVLDERFYKINTDDICSIILSALYIGKYPAKLVNKLFNSKYLMQVTNQDTMKKLYLIDTALSLEYNDYAGPRLPKDQCSKPVSQDPRIRNILKKTRDVFASIAGGPDNLSIAVMVPYIYPDDSFLLDVMLHPAGLGGNTCNWKSKLVRNENIAVLIHLPDHYCSDNEHLVGPQVMRKRHLKILGLKVVSLKYSILSQYYTSCNTSGFTEYIADSINNAEECTNV